MPFQLLTFHRSYRIQLTINQSISLFVTTKHRFDLFVLMATSITVTINANHPDSNYGQKWHFHSAFWAKTDLHCTILVKYNQAYSVKTLQEVHFMPDDCIFSFQLFGSKMGDILEVAHDCTAAALSSWLAFNINQSHEHVRGYSLTWLSVLCSLLWPQCYVF